jgi:MFS transporter, DHA2 family, methylenomycin A resistance protein
VARGVLAERSLLLLALALALTFVPESTARRRASLDVRGQALGVVALGSLTFAFIEGGRLGFGSTAVVAALVLAAASGAAFVGAELRTPSPMLELRHFREPTFSAANLGAGLMNLGTLGALFALASSSSGSRSAPRRRPAWSCCRGSLRLPCSLP